MRPVSGSWYQLRSMCSTRWWVVKLRHRFRLDGPHLIPREVETLSGLVQRVHLRTKVAVAELENCSLLWT